MGMGKRARAIIGSGVAALSLAVFGASSALADDLMGQPTPGGIALQPAASPLKESAHFFHDIVLMPVITLISLLVAVMLVLALYYSVGLSLFGLDLALPVGIFTGLAVFVPYLGYGTGLLLASLTGLLQMGFASTALMVAVVYGVGQVLESFYLTPRLVGERIGLHPLVVIFALMAFGQLFGFVGVLVALPCSAVLLVAVRRLREQYFRSDLYNHD